MKFLSVIILLAITILGRAQKAPVRPNIVVILTDDQTYRAIGYENKLVQTPNLNKLAKRGVIFRNAFTATPICDASRASLLTGRYPKDHKAVALATQTFIDTVIMGKKYMTLAQHLSQNGYRTFFCGKSHLGRPGDYGFMYGSESKDIKDSTAFAQARNFIQPYLSDRSPFLLWIGARQPHIPLRPSSEYLDRYAKTGIRVDPNFLEQPPQESFFNQGLPGELFFRDSDQVDNYMRLPAGPPRSKKTMQSFIKAYCATISHLDDQVGDLIQDLTTKGLMESTVIVFVSDNGYFLGNHGLGNKITMHEESVHVPFFISQGTKNKSLEYHGLVSTLDIFPTILELAGIPLPEALPGRSLLPVLAGGTKEVHQVVLSECTGVGGKPGMGHRMVRSQSWKYIVSDAGEEALFNMVLDPYELNNVVLENSNSPELMTLKSQLENWKE